MRHLVPIPTVEGATGMQWANPEEQECWDAIVEEWSRPDAFTGKAGPLTLEKVQTAMQRVVDARAERGVSPDVWDSYALQTALNTIGETE